MSEKKRRGRPKKYNFLDEPISKEEYNKKWYEAHRQQATEKYKEQKEDIKQKYNDNKEDFKQKSKELQTKYRDSYRLLKILYERGGLPDDIFEQIKKIID